MSECLEKYEYGVINAKLKEKLIEFALEVHSKNIGLLVKANVDVPTDGATTNTYNTDNNVYVYLLHPRLVKRVEDHYLKFANTLGLSEDPLRGTLIQIIDGPIQGEESNTIHPHVDPDCRPASFMYILSPGGDNVTTSWYNIKQKSTIKYAEQVTKEVHVFDLPIYAKENLELIEEHVMQEDCWYLFNNSIPHGVENIKSTRITLWSIPNFLEIREEFEKTNVTDKSKLSIGWNSLECMKYDTLD